MCQATGGERRGLELPAGTTSPTLVGAFDLVDAEAGAQHARNNASDVGGVKKCKHTRGLGTTGHDTIITIHDGRLTPAPPHHPGLPGLAGTSASRGRQSHRWTATCTRRNG